LSVEATKVAAVEWEKKKAQDVAPVSKRKNPSGGEKDKEVVSKTSQQATTKP
jgi:hypothetical protein